MEDTKSLLLMVLHKVFENEPKTIEKIFQLIHNFNNGKTEKANYEQTLKSICELINDQLPSVILVYLLSLVDIPQGLDSHSEVIKNMRKTHDFLPAMNVRPHLLDYLNNLNTNSKVRIYTPKSESSEVSVGTDNKNKVNVFVKPTKVIRRSRKFVPKLKESPRSLLDLCAAYVVKNEDNLKIMYQNLQQKTWTLVHNEQNTCISTPDCYKILGDLNKKLRWLREIESGNISYEMLFDEYENSKIILRDFEEDRDPFAWTQEIETFIEKIIK